MRGTSLAFAPFALALAFRSAIEAEEIMKTARTNCEGCPFLDAHRRCSLLLEGRMRQLLAFDACAMHTRFKPVVELFFTRQFTRFARHADDVAQDVLRELIEAADGTYHFSKLEDFLGWLPRQLQRRTIDALRKAKEIARPRCGACAHFSSRTGCRLNPILAVNASTAPASLPEPCTMFRWAQPTMAFPEAFEPASPMSAVAEEADEELLERALRQLEARDPKGRKAVTAIRLHSLGGLTMMQAGALLGVSHMSIKRAVDYGVRELRSILSRMYGERIAC